MRVQLETDGGFGYFPGLAQPISLDTDELPAEQAEALTRLAREADLFARPVETPPAEGSADHRTYTLTIEDEGRTHAVTVSDPVGDDALRGLIDYLRQNAGR